MSVRKICEEKVEQLEQELQKDSADIQKLHNELDYMPAYTSNTRVIMSRLDEMREKYNKKFIRYYQMRKDCEKEK